MSIDSFEYKASGLSSVGPRGSSLNLDEAQGIVECFVAGIGNKDSVGDIVASGAFTKSLMRRKPRVVWGHSWNDPIGKVLDIYEVPTTDPRLPLKMKMAGIGGLFAKVQFNLNSEKGREAFANVAFFGEEQEWSIGYKTLRAQFDQKAQANVIYELELYEVSPVLHGANQLTGTISIKTDAQTAEDTDGSYRMPADREEMQKQLSMMYGPKTMVVESDAETVTFAKPNEKGVLEKYKCHWMRNGPSFMFGTPQRVIAPQVSPSSPISVPNYGPLNMEPQRIVRPQQMPAIPVAIKPNPIGPGTVMVPLPPVQYDGDNKPVDKNNLDKEESDLRDALRKIVKRHGRFNEDSDGVWAGYYPPEKNPVASIGVKCANCVFYKGGPECEIISLPVHPEGKCRFAVIPKGVVNVSGADKKSVEELEEKEQLGYLAELEVKYPGELVLAAVRGAIGRIGKKRRKRKFKDLSEFDENEIDEKGYCISVSTDEAFEVKQLLDPIFEYHGADAFVDIQGIVVKSGITNDFIDAVDNALHNYAVKKKFYDEVEVKNLGRRVASYGASRLIDRPRLGGGRRGFGGPGIPQGDLNPDTRVDKNRNGLLFDRIPGWEMPDPTPYGPGSIYNADLTPEQRRDVRKIGAEGREITGEATEKLPKIDGADSPFTSKPKPQKAKPNEQRRLSSGRNSGRHGQGRAHEEKYGVSRDEKERREKFDKIAQNWVDSGMGWEEVPRYSADKKETESFLRGRELGVNQSRVAWRGSGRADGKRPDSFDEKAKASRDYADWYAKYSGHLGNFIRVLNTRENDKTPDDEKDFNRGIRNGIAGEVNGKMPDTKSWRKEDRETLSQWLKDYGFDPQESRDGRLSSGLNPNLPKQGERGRMTNIPGLDGGFDPDNPYGDVDAPYDLGFDVYDKIIEEFLGEEIPSAERPRWSAPRKPMTDKEIYDRRMAGATLDEMAKELMITRQEVRQRELRHMNEMRRIAAGGKKKYKKRYPRKAGELSRKEQESIYSERIDGASSKKLSKKYGISRNDVDSIVNAVSKRKKRREDKDSKTRREKEVAELTKRQNLDAEKLAEENYGRLSSGGSVEPGYEDKTKIAIKKMPADVREYLNDRIRRQREIKKDSSYAKLLEKLRDGFELNAQERDLIIDDLERVEAAWIRDGGIDSFSKGSYTAAERYSAARLNTLLNRNNKYFRVPSGTEIRDLDIEKDRAYEFRSPSRLSSGVNNEKIFKQGALRAVTSSLPKEEQDRLSSGQQTLSPEQLQQTFDGIAAQILESIEKALANPFEEWERPWADIDNYARNATEVKYNPAGKAYEGMNQMILSFAASNNGWKTNRWAGPKQWKKLGGKVRPGEDDKYTEILAPDLDSQGRKIPGAFHTTKVYNVAQIDGLPPEMYEPTKMNISDDERVEAVQNIIKELSPEFEEGNFGGAFYSPKQDKIFMPKFGTFKDAQSFYAVLLHEMTHWTSHPSRLNRKLGRMNAPRDSDEFQRYAFEELIAEIGSALVMGILGMEPEFREDHGKYLAHWSSRLKSDPTALRKAIAEGQKAADYMLNRSPTMRQMLGMAPDERKTDATLRIDIPMLEGMEGAKKVPGPGKLRGTFEMPETEDGDRLSSGKIEEFASRPFKAGKTHKIGTRGWRAVDRENGDREVYHYSTLMGFVRDGKYYESSVGWGSVSDKQGIRKILRALGQDKPLIASDIEAVDRLSSGKIEDLATRPFVRGKSMRVGSNRSWRSFDNQNGDREIHHYGTQMGYIRDGVFYQTSDGWGSVSDKQGIRKILRSLGQSEAKRDPDIFSAYTEEEKRFPRFSPIRKADDGTVIDSTGRLSSGADGKEIEPRKTKTGKKAPKTIKKTSKEVSFSAAHNLGAEPTQQQRNIVDAAFELVANGKTNVISVQAAAGTGKTWTLKAFAKALDNVFDLEKARTPEEAQHKLQYISERFGVDFSGLSDEKIKQELARLKERFGGKNIYYAVYNVSQQKKAEPSFPKNTGVSTLDKIAFWGLRLGAADGKFGDHIKRKMEVVANGAKRATSFDSDGNPIRKKTSVRRKDGKLKQFKVKDYKTGTWKTLDGEYPTFEDSGLVYLSLGKDFVKHFGLDKRYHTLDKADTNKKPIPTGGHGALARMTPDDLGHILAKALENWAYSEDEKLLPKHFALTESEMEERASARRAKKKSKKRVKKFGKKDKLEGTEGEPKESPFELEESAPLAESDWFLEATKNPDGLIPKEWVEIGQKAVDELTQEYVTDEKGKKVLSIVAPDQTQQFKLFAMTEPDLTTGKYMIGHAPGSSKKKVRTSGKIGDYVDSDGNPVNMKKVSADQLNDLWVVTGIPTAEAENERKQAQIQKVFASEAKPLSGILVDEAQDLNPIMMNILNANRNRMPIVLVGDSRQRIYNWRRAVDALQLMDPDYVLPLNESFRFGDRVAFMANIIQSLINVQNDEMGVKDSIKQFVSGHYHKFVEQQFDRSIQLLKKPKLSRDEKNELDDLLNIIDNDFGISKTLGPSKNGLNSNGDMISLAKDDDPDLSKEEKIKLLKSTKESAVNEARGVIHDTEALRLDENGKPIERKVNGKPLLDEDGEPVYETVGPLLPEAGRSFAHITRDNAEIFSAAAFYGIVIQARLEKKNKEIEKKLGRQLSKAEKFNLQIATSPKKHDDMVKFFEHLKWALASDKYKSMVGKPEMSPLIGNNWSYDEIWPLLGQSKYQQLTSLWDQVFKVEGGKVEYSSPQEFLDLLLGRIDPKTKEITPPTIIKERETMNVNPEWGQEKMTASHIKKLVGRKNAKLQAREDAGRSENPSQVEPIVIIPGKGKNEQIRDVHAHIVLEEGTGSDKTPGKWARKVHITGQGISGRKAYPPDSSGKKKKPRGEGLYNEDVKRIMLTHPRLSKYFVFKEDGGIVRRQSTVRNDAWEISLDHPEIDGNEEMFSSLIREAAYEIRKAANSHGADARVTTAAMFKGDEADDLVIGSSFQDAFLSADMTKVKGGGEISDNLLSELHQVYVALSRPRKRIDPGPVVSALYFGREGDTDAEIDSAAKVGLLRRKKAIDAINAEVARLEATGDPEDKALADAIRPPKDFKFPYQLESAEHKKKRKKASTPDDQDDESTDKKNKERRENKKKFKDEIDKKNKEDQVSAPEEQDAEEADGEIDDFGVDEMDGQEDLPDIDDDSIIGQRLNSGKQSRRAARKARLSSGENNEPEEPSDEEQMADYEYLRSIGFFPDPTDEEMEAEYQDAIKRGIVPPPEERLSSGGRRERRMRRVGGQQRLSSGSNIDTYSLTGYTNDDESNERAKRVWEMARKNGWLVNTTVSSKNPDEKKKAIRTALDSVSRKLQTNRSPVRIGRVSANNVETANGNTWMLPVSKLRDMIRIPESWNSDGIVRSSNPISVNDLIDLLGITDPKQRELLKEDDAGISFNSVMNLIAELGNQPELSTWRLFSPTTSDEDDIQQMAGKDLLTENVARSLMRERFMIETFGKDAYPSFQTRNGRKINGQQFDRLSVDEDDNEKFSARGMWPDTEYDDANNDLVMEGMSRRSVPSKPARIKFKPEEAQEPKTTAKTQKNEFAVRDLLESLGISPDEKNWPEELQKRINKTGKSKISVVGNEKTQKRWEDGGVPTAVIKEMIRLGLIKDAKSVFKNNDSGSRLDDELKGVKYAVYEALNNFINARHGESPMNTRDTRFAILGTRDIHTYLPSVSKVKGQTFSPSKGDEPRFDREEMQIMVNRFNERFGTSYTIDDIFSDEQLRQAKEKIENGEHSPIGKPRKNRTVIMNDKQD